MTQTSITALAQRTSQFFADSPAASSSDAVIHAQNSLLPRHLTLLRYLEPSHLECSLYEPVICLILQGRKEVILGDRSLIFGPGESLIVSHELPVVSRVTEASPEKPYLSLVLTLDLSILRSLYEQISETQTARKQAYALDVSQTEAELVDALRRYLALIGKPLEQEVMAPLLLKEIHFRLLTASHGAMLQQLLWRDSHASRIGRAIETIRRNFRGPLVVPDLARLVGMSEASFYQHFKSITTTTPLQYQKELRLLEARQLLLTGDHSVGHVAFEVGYESPTQFSREYTRKFGVSPRQALVTAS